MRNYNPQKTYAMELFNYILIHHNDVTIGAIASQITSLTIVFLTVYLDTD